VPLIVIVGGLKAQRCSFRIGVQKFAPLDRSGGDLEDFGDRATSNREGWRTPNNSSRPYALEFSPAFLARAAAAGLSLVHEVYPVPQNW
jgi:hypothetical protein